MPDYGVTTEDFAKGVAAVRSCFPSVADLTRKREASWLPPDIAPGWRMREQLLALSREIAEFAAILPSMSQAVLEAEAILRRYRIAIHAERLAAWYPWR